MRGNLHRKRTISHEFQKWWLTLPWIHICAFPNAQQPSQKMQNVFLKHAAKVHCVYVAIMTCKPWLECHLQLGCFHICTFPNAQQSTQKVCCKYILHLHCYAFISVHFQTHSNLDRKCMHVSKKFRKCALCLRHHDGILITIGVSLTIRLLLHLCISECIATHAEYMHFAACFGNTLRYHNGKGNAHVQMWPNACFLYRLPHIQKQIWIQSK